MVKSMNKTILVLAVATAFVIGTITTGTLAYASGDKNGKPFEQIWEAIHNLETTGSSGSETPISLGHIRIDTTITPCTNSAGNDINSSGGPVLLSDGTVKIPSGTGFKTLDPAFGSLPAGVWHDIEGTSGVFLTPAGCFFPSQTANNIELITACAVNDNGDVYCVLNGQARDGVLEFGTPWTFQGNALS